MANPGPTGNADVFDLERLRDLIELMKEYDLREVDLKQEKQHIRLSRGVDFSHATSFAVAQTPMAQSSQPATQSEPAPSPPTTSANLVTIDSPMVGTFYLKPNPDAPPFVKVGDHVGPDTVVCIIEAMKVFNEIQAEVAGKVVAVLINNEESCDFGRPLFKIDTSA